MTQPLENMPEENGGAGAIPLLPLRDIVIFPEMVTPLFVGRPRSIKALEEAMGGERHIFLVAQNDSAIDEPVKEDLYTVGTIAKISQLLKLPDGTVKLLVEGISRATVDRLIEQDDFTLVTYDEIEDVQAGSLEAEALVRGVRTLFEAYVTFSRKIPSEVVAAVENVTLPSVLADTIAAHLSS